jgi:hypothetical protein
MPALLDRDAASGSPPMTDQAHLAGLLAAADFNLMSEPALDTGRWLRSQGVDIARALNIAGPIIEHSIAVFDGAAFDFAAPDDPHAVRAVVHVVHGDDAETPVDLVAWTRAHPDRALLCLGAGVALGVDQIANPESYFAGKPLQIHRTPLGWLRAGCAGIVILGADGVVDRLDRLPPRSETYKLVAEDLDHGRELRRLLAPLRPRVRLFVPWENAA